MLNVISNSYASILYIYELSYLIEGILWKSAKSKQLILCVLISEIILSLVIINNLFESLRFYFGYGKTKTKYRNNFKDLHVVSRSSIGSC